MCVETSSSLPARRGSHGCAHILPAGGETERRTRGRGGGGGGFCQPDVTAYEWPSLKDCMHCCSISAPSVMSMSLNHCRERPQEKQNGVNRLRSCPQNGQNISSCHHSFERLIHFLVLGTRPFLFGRPSLSGLCHL